MKLASFKKEFLKSITPLYNKDEASSLYYMLCEESLALSKSKLIIAENMDLSIGKTNQLYNCLDRLKKHEPIQYVLGKTKFCNLNFYVNESVLIPRPETEELVRLMLKEDLDGKEILDIGTGSGCIAISLAKNSPNAKVSAIDISEDALKVARENAKLNNVDINFINADIFDYQTDKKYDVIVSNPPYVTESEKALMKSNVLKYEPELALFVEDKDPLKYYEQIIEYYQPSKSGKLFFEINSKFMQQIKNLLNNYEYRIMSFKLDSNNNYRFLFLEL